MTDRRDGTEATPGPSLSGPEAHRKGFYLALWRWHFYAGVFVIPFLVVLSLSGLLMLLSEPVDRILAPERHRVEAQGPALDPETQLAVVESGYPGGEVALFIPPREPHRPSQFSVQPDGGGHGHHGSGHGPAAQGASLTIFLDPYRGEIVGEVDPSRTLDAWATRIHSTLLLGSLGDVLLEIAAGMGVLLLLTGLYLWWPREGLRLRGIVWPRARGSGRSFWRDLHAVSGFWISGALLFFLLTGLAWTEVWGGRMVQAWSTLPSERSTAPASDQRYADLNRPPFREVPWALEQARLPASTAPRQDSDMADHDHMDHGQMGHGTMDHRGVDPPGGFGLNDVAEAAERAGFRNFRVFFPQGEEGAWTIQAVTMTGDVTDPRQDRTLHLDRYTGEVLADVGFEAYSLPGKAMAAGIAFHQGDAGPVNAVLNALFASGVLLLSGSAAVMWWRRRPAGAGRLVPPPLPANHRIWRRAMVLLGLGSLAFPLVAATLLTVFVVDRMLLARVPAFRQVFR